MRHETDWPTPEELKALAREREQRNSCKSRSTSWRERIKTAFACLIFGLFAFIVVVAALAGIGFSLASSMLLAAAILTAFLVAWDTPR